MICEENGKTFYRVGKKYSRIHDDKYDGKETVYYRCENCKKLVHRSWVTAHKGIRYNTFQCTKK